jgi:hypothetical protein
MTEPAAEQTEEQTQNTEQAETADLPPTTEPDPDPTEPEPEPEPTPDPIPDPDPITWEPQTWYEATAACRTPGCIQENVIVYLPMLYSNNGDPKYIRVICGSDQACGKDCTILTATKLDPQPPEE